MSLLSSPSYAECDAANAVCWNFGVCFLPADPEEHKGVGGDGGGGVQGLTQPAGRATLVHFHYHLQNREEESKGHDPDRDPLTSKQTLFHLYMYMLLL